MLTSLLKEGNALGPASHATMTQVRHSVLLAEGLPLQQRVGWEELLTGPLVCGLGQFKGLDGR